MWGTPETDTEIIECRNWILVCNLQRLFPNPLGNESNLTHVKPLNINFLKNIKELVK